MTVTCTPAATSPCTERHCPGCGRNHLDTAHPAYCPSCVGEARHLIRDVVDQVLEAHLQHEHRAITSAAVMVAGPAASYERTSYLHQSATSGRLCKCRRRGLASCVADEPVPEGASPLVCPEAMFVFDTHRDDTLHPATVLQAWDLAWRRALDHDTEPLAGPRDGRTNLSPTIGATSTYLLTQLTYMAQRPEGELEALITDLRACRAWLQAILDTGDGPVVKGEKCPACRHRHLERRDDDHWTCPNPVCAQVWTDTEYFTRVSSEYVTNATALPIADLAVRVDVPASTLRNWATAYWRTTKGVKTRVSARLVPTGRDYFGRNVYDVTATETVRDQLRKDKTA